MPRAFSPISNSPRVMWRLRGRYGQQAVERLLDAAHAVMSHGVHRHPRKRRPDLVSEERREAERRRHRSRSIATSGAPFRAPSVGCRDGSNSRRSAARSKLPQENILYFLEKAAPRLKPWQREILRIVRHIAQYFYPQKQTKVMNEGCATYSPPPIMTALHDAARSPTAPFSSSCSRTPCDPSSRSSTISISGGINPYALGFAMMQDIDRICVDPTEEDHAGSPRLPAMATHGARSSKWANYRDESFVSQFLSPSLIREWRMFHLMDDAEEPELLVSAIHDDGAIVASGACWRSNMTWLARSRHRGCRCRPRGAIAA